MQLKATLVYGVYIVGAVPILILAFTSRIGLLPITIWIGLFGVTHATLLNCPHCQSSATRARGGIPIHTPWVGTKCRHCGKPY
jgi:hypothetical protein